MLFPGVQQPLVDHQLAVLPQNSWNSQPVCATQRMLHKERNAVPVTCRAMLASQASALSLSVQCQLGL